MPQRWFLLSVSLFVCAASAEAVAPPAVRSSAGAKAGGTEPLHRTIDRLVSAPKDFAQFDAGPAPDGEFLRRAYLDLTGTIPTATVARAFLKDASPTKRQFLIDGLLASPEHSRHLANVFDVMLMERRADRLVPRAAWHSYLRDAFAANKPWDELAREILASNGADPKTRPAAKFFLERGEPHLLTRDIGRLFLGMNLQCCQCHDHPRIEDYRQEHYYGIFAFIGRTTVLNAKGTGVISEKADGETTFQSVFDPAKVTKTSLPRVPGGKGLADTVVPKDKLYVVAPTAGAAGVPTYSRRARLAPEVTRADYEPFRRNIANRLWAHMLGRGLVHPLDMDYPGNQPSHAELLDALSADIAARKFDMRGFMREIGLSQTYARSSALPAGVKETDAPLYATALLKPLTPEQFGFALMQATGLTDSIRQSQGKTATEQSLYTALSPNLAPFIRAFGSPAGTPQGFDATVDQALFLANGPTLRSWLTPRAGNLTDRLLKLAGNDAVAEELYLSILTRLPDAEERKEVADFLTSRTKDRSAALQDLAWALLTSTEFRFNH